MQVMMWDISRSHHRGEGNNWVLGVNQVEEGE
jgi:hypothetical protein